MKMVIGLTSITLLVGAVFCAQATPRIDSQQLAIHHADAQAEEPIDLNTADVETLSKLKGIGLKKAKAIVEYREKSGNFRALNDLSSVPGFSNKLVARVIKDNPHLTINS